jgi:hypothetical protein
MSSGPRSGKRNKPGKVGRNDPCFCGSGLKYKKCHLLEGVKPPRPVAIPYEELEKHQQESQERKDFLRSKGIYVELPNTISHKGKTLLAVGNQIMVEENPYATFHQLLFRNLQQTLGEEWWTQQEGKPVDEQHYIYRCFLELRGSEKRDDLNVTQVDEHTRSMVTTGNTQALLSLAFDVWMLAHKSYLRDEWMNRLRNRNEYQGVRYEIGVASMFVRQGCELEFYDNDRIEEDGRPPKRAEFVAVHTESGNKVAVEAKSRQVHGVLHTPGTLNYRRAIKGDINDLYKKALLKVTDGLPLIIFIDVNSPSEAGQAVQESQWFADIRRSFDSRPEPTDENPDKHAAIFITNYSSHYQGDQASIGGQHLYIGSLHTVVPLKDGHMGMFMKRLLRTVANYGYVPPTMDNEKLGQFKQNNGLSRANFVKKLTVLTMPQNGDPEYERKKRESDGLIEMLVWDTTQKSGGGWDNEIAEETYVQFEWMFTH